MLAAHLQAYPAAVHTADPALFVDEARKLLTDRRWKRLLTDARTAAGDEVTSHSFRHFAASALISGGASVKRVQTFLGHASAVITLRTYAHMWPGDEDRTRNVLDAALSVLEHNPEIIRAVAAPKQRYRSSEARKPQAAFWAPNRPAQVVTGDWRWHSPLTCTDIPFDRWSSMTVYERLADSLRTRQQSPGSWAIAPNLVGLGRDGY